MVSIRRGIPCDEDDLIRIRNSALQQRAAEIEETLDFSRVIDYGTPAEEIHPNKFANKDRRILVAEANGTVIGWGVVFLGDESLGVVFLDPEWEEPELREMFATRFETVVKNTTSQELTVLVY